MDKILFEVCIVFAITAQMIPPSFSQPLTTDDTTYVTDATVSMESNSLQNVQSRFAEISATPCASNETFCEETPEYPTEIVQNILKKHADALKLLIKYESDYKVDTRVGGSFDTNLCSAARKNVYPRAALTAHGWRYVINVDGLQQTFETEICHNSGSTCIGGLSENFMCEQKYLFRRVLVLLNADDVPIFQQVKFPSCCVCVLKKTPFA